MTQLPIPVHVGSDPPSSWDDVEAMQASTGRHLVSSRAGWASMPPIALQPSIFAGQGADEFDRFRQGAERRGEIALVLSPIGDLEDKPRGVLVQHDDSISLGRFYTNIGSQRIGKGARVRAAVDLGDADGQLALRLLSCSPAPMWRVVSLSGVTLESYNSREHHPAQGTLVPIVETELGEPVVAAWVSPDAVERVVIDTAPTGHTLLLLDTTGAYHRQIVNAPGQPPGRVVTPLMRLQEPAYTKVLIITLAETTPVAEAADLQDDLRRAGIEPYGWVINATLVDSGTADPVLAARALLEQAQLDRVASIAPRLWKLPWDPAIATAH